MYIALDFDGTCCESAFPEIGLIQVQHRKVHEFIRKAHKAGHCIILWTCRENNPERAYLDEAVSWCKAHNIPINYVNENPENKMNRDGLISRKIYADMYVDDRAVHISYVDRLSELMLL